MSEEMILEARRVTRVNSKGEKTKKVKCPKGYKRSSDGNSCERMSADEKRSRKKSIKKAIRTRKQHSQTSSNRKRRKALKKRKSYGL